MFINYLLLNANRHGPSASLPINIALFVVFRNVMYIPSHNIVLILWKIEHKNNDEQYSNRKQLISGVFVQQVFS